MLSYALSKQAVARYKQRCLHLATLTALLQAALGCRELPPQTNGLAPAATAPPLQGESPTSSFGVIGGVDTAEPHFFAALTHVATGERFCGGSFISERVVVTAAHCVHDLGPQKVLIRKSLSQPKRHIDIRVNYITVHPAYDPQTLRNDIALVFLQDHDAVASAQPIALNRNANFPHEHQATPLIAIGYGNTTNFGRKLISSMQLVELPLVPTADCHRLYEGLFGLIDASQICAGDTVKGGRDTCQGDSGGPLYSVNTDDGTPVLVGLVSYGQGCADKAFPGVYSRLSHFGTWIEATLQAGQSLPAQPTSGDMRRFLAHYCSYDYHVEERYAAHELADSFQVNRLRIIKRLRIAGSWSKLISMAADAFFAEQSIAEQSIAEQMAAADNHDQQHALHYPLCQVETKAGAHLSLSAVFSEPLTAADGSLPQPYQMSLQLQEGDVTRSWTARATASLTELHIGYGAGEEFHHELKPHDESFATGSTALLTAGKMGDEPAAAETLFELNNEGVHYRFLKLPLRYGKRKYGIEYTTEDTDVPRRYFLTIADESAGSALRLQQKPAAEHPSHGELTVLNTASYPVYNWALSCQHPLILRDKSGQQFIAHPVKHTGLYHTDFSRTASYATLGLRSATSFTYTIPSTSAAESGEINCTINGRTIPIDRVVQRS